MCGGKTRVRSTKPGPYLRKALPWTNHAYPRSSGQYPRGVAVVLGLFFLSVAHTPALAQEAQVWAQTGRIVSPAEEPVKVSFSCILGDHPVCGSSLTDFGAAVAVDGDTIVVGSPHAQTIDIYRRAVQVIEHQATLTGPPGFGSAVTISGDILVAGARASSEAYVYSRTAEGWTLSTTITHENGCLGRSVDLTEDRVVVGDHCASKIHVIETEHWTKSAELSLAGVSKLGVNVAAANGFVVAHSDEGTYVFEENGGEWTSTLLIAESAGRIAASGGRIIATSSTSVLVFEHTASEWRQVASLVPSDSSPFSRYDGALLSPVIQGDTVAVGLVLDDPSPGSPGFPDQIPAPCAGQFGIRLCLPPRAGAVYVFDVTASGWTQTAKLVGDPIGDPQFGSAISLTPDERTLVVGAPYKLLSSVAGQVDVDPEDSVHVFERVLQGDL